MLVEEKRLSRVINFQDMSFDTEESSYDAELENMEAELIKTSLDIKRQAEVKYFTLKIQIELQKRVFETCDVA